MVDFKQIRGSNFRKFKLTPSKIIIETRSSRKNIKYEVKLDRLGFDIFYQSDNTTPGIIMFGICIAIIIGATIEHFTSGTLDTPGLIVTWISCCGFCLLNYLKQHQDDIYLTGGEVNLVFYRNKPNEETVLNFIEEVKKQTKLFLKEKYTVFDDTTTEHDFYNRMIWLREHEIIDQNEYITYINEFEIQKLL